MLCLTTLKTVSVSYTHYNIPNSLVKVKSTCLLCIINFVENIKYFVMHSLADEIKCEEESEAVELPTEPENYLVEPQQQDSSSSEDEMV